MDVCPTVLIEGEHMVLFIDEHEAMRYWMFLPNRDEVLVVRLNPDMKSGGWIMPS